MRKSHLHLYGQPAQENLDVQQEAKVEEQATAAGTSPEVEVAVVDPQPVATETESIGDGLEEALIMLNEGVTKAEDNEIAIDNTNDVLTKLEVATEHLLPTIIQNGGLDRNGAAVLNWALEGLYERVGLPGKSNGLAVESYGSTMSKVDATTLSMEEAKANAGEIWGKLVELWEKAMAHIAELWNKYFDSATKLRARAEQVKKSATSANGQAKSKTITSPTAKEITLNRKADIKAAVQRLGQGATELENFMKISKDEAAELLKALTSGKTEALKYEIPNGFAVVDPARVGMPQPEEGMALYSSKFEMPGNKCLVLIAPSEPQSAPASLLARTASRYGAFDSSFKPGDDLPLVMLSPAELAKAAEDLARVADAALKYKEVQGEIDSTRKQAIAKAKEMIKGGQANDSLTDMVKACLAVASQFGPITAAAFVTTGFSVIQLLETQLKEYSVSQTEAKPAEKPAEQKPAEKPAEAPKEPPTPPKEPEAKAPPKADEPAAA